MPTSTFLAKLIGPILVVMGLGLLLNADGFRAVAEEFLRSRALIYLSGLLSMAAGLALVLHHNVWAADWRVVVTILGWGATIGGAVRILLPDQVQAIARGAIAHPANLAIAGGAVTALGAVLCFFGYVRNGSVSRTGAIS